MKGELRVSVDNENKLSIIIPYYNSPHTLEKLLHSIPRKDDIEIIVVNDRSDKFTEEYEILKVSDDYSHVRFIENLTSKKGTGTCINIGLSNVTGKWILIAGADDYFLDDFYGKVGKYFETDYDVVFFSPTSVYLETGKIATRHLYYKQLIENYLNGLPDSELMLRYDFHSPCSKMIRSELIRQHTITCDEVLVCNDDMFSIKVGYYMKKFTATREEIYCITDHAASLSRKKGKEYFYSCFDVKLRIDDFLKEHLDKRDYKKLRLVGISVLYHAINRYNLGLKDLANIVAILSRKKIPFLSVSYIRRTLNRLFDKLFVI